MSILRFVCLVVVVAAEGFWDIQINLQSLKSVPFGSAHVSVWEHASTPGRYFASPLVCLQPDTATVLENFFTGRTQLDFSVLLWSREAKEAVYNYMKDHVNASIVRDQIELLPMEKIRLVWQNRQNLPDFYQVGDDWRSNSHLPTLVRFNIACRDLQKCRELETGMKTTPHAFNGLELEYQINAQKSARRRLVVKGDHLIGGELYTSLVNMPVHTGIRFLTGDDVARLASETTTNVMATLTTDEDYGVDEDEEVSVTELLRTVLQRQVVSTEEFQPRMWESVYWDSDVARPDKVKEYLNKILTIDQTNTSRFLLNESERDLTTEASFSFHGIFSVGDSSVSRVGKADVVNTIQQRHHDVEWSGERFVVRPMRLSRLNLASLNQSVTIATTRIQVKQFDTVKSIKLRTNCYARNQTSRMAAPPGVVEFTRSLTSIIGNRLETVLNATLESQMQLGNRLETVLSSTVESQSQLGNELKTALTSVVNSQSQLGNQLESSLTSVVNSQSQLGNKLETALESAVNTQSQLGNELKRSLNSAVNTQSQLGHKLERALNSASNSQSQLGNELKRALNSAVNSQSQLGHKLERALNSAANSQSQLGNELKRSLNSAVNSQSQLGNELKRSLKSAVNSQSQLGHNLERALNSVVNSHSQLGDKLETALNNTVNRMFDILPKTEWPEYCSISGGYYCNLTNIRGFGETSLSECRDFCSGDSRCGTFTHRDDNCWLDRFCPPDSIIKVNNANLFYLKMSAPFMRLKFSYHYITNGSWPMMTSGDPCKLLGSEWMSG